MSPGPPKRVRHATVLKLKEFGMTTVCLTDDDFALRNAGLGRFDIPEIPNPILPEHAAVPGCYQSVYNQLLHCDGVPNPMEELL